MFLFLWLHDNPEISKETIKRVKEVAQFFNYQSNKIAQSIKANHLGYNIPKELSVIGFTDEQISNLSLSKFSYLNQNAQQIGNKALHLKLNRLKEKTNITDFITEKITTTFAKQEPI